MKILHGLISTHIKSSLTDFSVLSDQKNIMIMFTLTVLVSFLLCAHRSWEKENTVEEEKVPGTYLGNIANDSSNMDKGVYSISTENQPSDTQSQLQFIVKD